MVFIERFTQWLKQPFSQEMDAFGWFLFIGLLMLILVGWGTIISKVGE